MARLNDEPMIVLRRALDMPFVLLLGTQMMSSGWSSMSGILACRSLFNGRGVSLSPSGVRRIIWVLLSAADWVGPAAIASTCDAVILLSSITNPPEIGRASCRERV